MILVTIEVNPFNMEVPEKIHMEIHPYYQSDADTVQDLIAMIDKLISEVVR